jgi:hypothetical protein
MMFHTHMFQVYVLNISSVFRCMLQCFIWMLQNYIGTLHIYASVLGVFIRMLQVFHLNVCIYLQWLHMCFQVFSGVLQVF